MPAKVTITTVAKATGLSLATVSRALAGAENVLPQTREKVLAAAQSLNYVRDRTAVRLKTGKTHVLAFIMDRRDARHPGFMGLMLGVSDAIAGSEYHMVVLPDEASDPLATIKYVTERGLADALVISHTQADDERVQYLLDAGMPFVAHGRTNSPVPHGYVDFDNAAYSANAVHALAARGRKKLALLLPSPGGLFYSHLLDGFESACRMHGLEGTPIQGVSLDRSPTDLYAWAMAEATQYDGIITSREAPVVALLGALNARQIQLGRDMDLVIKHSTPFPQFVHQPLLGCFEDLHQAGWHIGQVLLDYFNRPQQPMGQFLFQPPKIEVFHELERT